MLEILFPGGITKEFRKTHAIETAKFWHHNDVQYTMKAIDTDTGDIIGMILFDLYFRDSSKEERKYHGIPWLEGKQRERADKVIGALHDMHEKIWGGRRHLGKFEI